MNFKRRSFNFLNCCEHYVACVRLKKLRRRNNLHIRCRSFILCISHQNNILFNTLHVVPTKISIFQEKNKMCSIVFLRISVREVKSLLFKYVTSNMNNFSMLDEDYHRFLNKIKQSPRAKEYFESYAE